MKNEQALRELLRRLRGGIRRGDESSSTLQTPDKGAERGEMIAPRTKGGEKDLHRAFLRRGERSKVLREEGEEGERSLLNIDAGEEKLENVVSHKANEERGEELAERALKSSIRLGRLSKERKESGVHFAAMSLEAKAPTRKLSGGEREGENAHWLTLLHFQGGRRFRSLRRTAG